MAVNLKQLKANCAAADVAPVSDIEAKYISAAEKFIDDEIIKKYNSDNTSIWIPLNIVNLDYNPLSKCVNTGLTSARKGFLKEILLKPYIEYGWEIEVHLDDGMDRFGSDYIIFKGK